MIWNHTRELLGSLLRGDANPSGGGAKLRYVTLRDVTPPDATADADGSTDGREGWNSYVDEKNETGPKNWLKL